MPFDLQSLKKELQPGSLKERVQNLNDRYTSPSSSSTGYTPGSARPYKPPAPLPPSAAARHTPAASNYQAPPPPPSRTLAPGLPQRNNSFNAPASTPSSLNAGHSKKVDWTNLSPRDKEGFFGMLDGVGLL